MSHTLHIGLLINPLAGLGGSLAMKGSDGATLRTHAREAGPPGRERSAQRVARAFATMGERSKEIRISTWAGEMGENALTELSGAFATDIEILGRSEQTLSSALDTKAAATSLLHHNVDILVFAGGDGTARDILDSVGTRIPVLGIPAGVKMHSGVFAVSPEAAGQLLGQLVAGNWVGLQLQEVRDIDEEAFRKDVVRSQFYGEMQVPSEGQYLQHTKVGGRESQALVVAEIATWMVEQIDPSVLTLLGPGSTLFALKEELGLPSPTLLGVDAVLGGEQVASDANEVKLLQLVEDAEAAQIILTAIGGQGHLFGRGNQQFSPQLIRAVGSGCIRILASKSKINGLEGRPILVDTNDPELDRTLSGYYPVVTGYDDTVLYRVSNNPNE
ncbi:MAG: putative polyphosphate/ATP-dependent NAD kinase [Bacteroidia bacterium]|jgi:predicted polyphosphate/ATP-dependent NAD kinase